jgi:hypothetical protein
MKMAAECFFLSWRLSVKLSGRRAGLAGGLLMSIQVSTQFRERSNARFHPRVSRSTRSRLMSG